MEEGSQLSTTAISSSRQTPAWFDEAKLGIFIHWNPAVIPAYAPVPSLRSIADLYKRDKTGVKAMRRNPYSDMYWNSMNIPGSPTERYHETHYPGMGYEAFVQVFRDEVLPSWDPQPWAELFARAGARYVVFTTKMDDGFLMWPSAHRNPFREGWQSERDVVGDLASAVRGHGLKFGTYYCGGQDWTFTGLPLADLNAFFNGVPSGDDYSAYADSHWYELIDRYEPAVLWNDYSYPIGSDISRLFEYYWERVSDGVVNNRFAPNATYWDFLTPEQSTAGSPRAKWETCHTLGTAWGFNRMESASSYLSAEDLIHMFVDIVSRGGNLLLNVGPTAAGAIPWLQAERLLALGWWLEVNGEAIYRTRPWTKSTGLTGEAIDVRYTASADAVYAIVLGTPPGRHVEIDVRLKEGTRVSLAKNHASLPWETTPAGVRVRLPDQLDTCPAISLRLEPKTSVHTFVEK